MSIGKWCFFLEEERDKKLWVTVTVKDRGRLAFPNSRSGFEERDSFVEKSGNNIQ